jgi:hypothetical protein
LVIFLLLNGGFILHSVFGASILRKVSRIHSILHISTGVLQITVRNKEAPILVATIAFGAIARGGTLGTFTF